jgi:hypothetical protein
MRKIFKIINLINSKIYVGKSSNDRPTYYGSGRAIKAAIKKYGKNNFKKEIIDSAETLLELNEKEKYWILYHSSHNPKIGYNRSFGGDGNWEHLTPEAEQQRLCSQLKTFRSDEFKNKKRQNTTEYYSNPLHRKEQSERIKKSYLKLSDEEKQKIKERLIKGSQKRWSNIKNREEASELWKKNNPSKRPEIRKKLSENRRGQNNPAAKKCEINGILYHSIIDACKTLGLTRNIISSRLKSNKFPTYKKI